MDIKKLVSVFADFSRSRLAYPLTSKVPRLSADNSSGENGLFFQR